VPSITRVLLSDARLLAAYVIFAGSYLVFALGKFPWMKIDRPGAAIIGASSWWRSGSWGGGEALASVDIATVVLLFAMMLIVGSLRLAGFFAWITDWMIERLHPQLAAPELQHGRLRKKPVLVLVVVLAGLLAGVPRAMTAAVGAALLLITRTVEPRRLYDEVDWGLLVFFVGLFIIVGGADRARLTARLLEPVNAWNLHRIPIFV